MQSIPSWVKISDLQALRNNGMWKYNIITSINKYIKIK